MRNIKLYDVHGTSAVENYLNLVTPDNKYFYWDSKKFGKYAVGDIVFWVNRSARVALFTSVDSLDIKPSFRDGKNLIDKGYNVSANAQDPTRFENFYRFKIIEKVDIPSNWNYANLVPFNGQTMAIILYEPGVKEPEKKIGKIEDLKILFQSSKEVNDLLNEAISLLRSNLFASSEKKTHKAMNETSKDVRNIITDFKTHLSDNNLIYDDRIIKRFICSLAAKPFVILTGNSGTGKTKLALEFARWISPETNYRVVPVGADWTDNRSVLGFYNPLIEKYNSTVILDLIIEADKNKNRLPFFLILDEMNLSHVERYFADFLSGFESNEKIHLHSNGNGTETASKKNIPEKIKLPDNLFVIGTVNVDETTYMFSPKVLDRANVIEIKTSEENLKAFSSSGKQKSSFNNDGKRFSELFLNTSLMTRGINGELPLPKNINAIEEYILNFFRLLSEFDYEFGFRTMKESLQYAKTVSELAEFNTDDISDEQVIQKILPKLNGSKGKLESILVGLIMLSSGKSYDTTSQFIKDNEKVRSFDKNRNEESEDNNLSRTKLLKMLRNLRRDQFVSFI